MNAIKQWFINFWADFQFVFMEKGRWKWVFEGVGNTLRITFFALLMGVALGIVVAAVRSTYDKNREAMARRKGIGYYLLKFFNGVCHVYLTVIRGTPVVVQLMIMYFIIFASSRDDILVATIAFGINSGAYVAEILRGGIMSIDNGQFEAGRSLGFNYVQTMFYIVIPQVFKSVLPTLCNEFIVLLKETAVAGYVSVSDLTYAGNIVGGNAYDYLFPLLLTALIYLVMVMFFTHLVGKLERRLRNSER